MSDLVIKLTMFVQNRPGRNRENLDGMVPDAVLGQVCEAAVITVQLHFLTHGHGTIWNNMEQYGTIWNNMEQYGTMTKTEHGGIINGHKVWIALTSLPSAGGPILGRRGKRGT